MHNRFFRFLVTIVCTALLVISVAPAATAFAQTSRSVQETEYTQNEYYEPPETLSQQILNFFTSSTTTIVAIILFVIVVGTVAYLAIGIVLLILLSGIGGK